MASIPDANPDLMAHVALIEARRQRQQYLDGLDQLLACVGHGEVASLEEIRQLFLTYEDPQMPTLSSEIETMRETR